MDVGEHEWPTDFDFGDAETDHRLPDNADEAMDAAFELEKVGDWDAAIAAYRKIADRWPEHATYITNCITGVQCKIDAAR